MKTKSVNVKSPGRKPDVESKMSLENNADSWPWINNKVAPMDKSAARKAGLAQRLVTARRKTAKAANGPTKTARGRRGSR